MNRPGKIICVGRNYAAHAQELGNEVPAEPLLFMKPPSAVIASGDPIVLPDTSEQVEHEGEIAVIISRTLQRATPAQASEAVAGFSCLNDVTARDLQRSDKQWTRAKGYDTFCPLGPAVTPVSRSDWRSLEIICRVNGDVRQHGYARDMIFGFEDLLAYISHIMTLEPGDVVATGTPEGVGPLRAGDVVEVEVPTVGRLENPVVARRADQSTQSQPRSA